MNYGAMTTALALFIAMLLAVLAVDWLRERRRARERAEAEARLRAMEAARRQVLELEAEIKALEAKLMRSFLHGSYEVSTRLAAARRELEAARAEMQSPSMVRAEKERGQKQRQLKLHWSWLLALAVLLAGSGVMALDWFADAHNQVTVSYSGK